MEVNQKAKEHLLDYISKVSPHFDSFFASQKEVSKNINEIALDMVVRYEDFIGGKRLRGALTKLGYDLFGGSPAFEEDVLKASSIIEIIHGFGLMHDDIMDEDELRRSKPTMHIQYEHVFDAKFSNSVRKKKLYGTAMAINVGDLGAFYANLIIDGTNFDPEIKMRFLKRVSQVVIQTVHGQGLDVTYELDSPPTEARVMDIHKFKTSFYTVPGPLQYGAILAGVSLEDPRYLALEKFGVPIGIAFQLRDDELGMFSTPEKFGKPIYSDLRQGKNTLLFAKAFELATPEQLAFLSSVHGNANVTESDLKKVNQILEESGSVAYSRELSWKLVEEGKLYIKDITQDPKQVELLEVLANYVVTRNS
ncbi:polyprenyl synthetase family protein [Patescibacteria group bacterium]|nr:polyprenyl synthetase family protein [Patescibacteria group bacterium]